jgi:dTDP-glucose 4,6-dehydratase
LKLNKNKILVTGADGFIGSHLTEKLVRCGYDVRAFVFYNSFNSWGWLDHSDPKIKKDLDIFAGDVRDPHGVKQAMKGCEVVFHLAALISIPYSYHSPDSYIDTNIKGTLNILQAARELGISKIIHTSTSEVYGTARFVPITEDHPLQGQSPYSASKIGADQMAESFFRSFGLPVATIRPFNTFGPRQSARAIIPTVITQILSGKKKIMLGSTNPVRDFTFVEDTVNGFIKIAESDQSVGQVINIGSGTGISIKDLVKTINSIIGSKVMISFDKNRVRPEKSEVMKLICSNRKAKRLAGWKPEHDLTAGLLQTIEYLRDNLDLYKTELYNI